MKEFQSVYEIRVRENLFLLFGSVRSFDQNKEMEAQKGTNQ